jgi:hypothetical protein
MEKHCPYLRYKIIEEKFLSTYLVFKVAAKNPEKEHIAKEMKKISMEEHRKERDKIKAKRISRNIRNVKINNDKNKYVNCYQIDSNFWDILEFQIRAYRYHTLILKGERR